jgi:hypothetical protein
MHESVCVTTLAYMHESVCDKTAYAKGEACRYQLLPWVARTNEHKHKRMHVLCVRAHKRIYDLCVRECGQASTFSSVDLLISAFNVGTWSNVCVQMNETSHFDTVAHV